MKRPICILFALLLSTTVFADNGIRLGTVVIDPGHGGVDPGAVSRDRKNYEKTFTLDIARKLADRIRKEYPDVNVILTRTGDTKPALDRRAAIANEANADLFISIHIDAAESVSANGFTVYVLGQYDSRNKDLYASNMNVCKRENSVILLEDDYSVKYEGFDPSDTESYIFMQLMQNSSLEQSVQFAQTVARKLKGGPIRNDRGVAQGPLMVLWATSMPSVLVELGYISNQNDLAALRQENNRASLAERLFEAFREYKLSYDGEDARPEEEAAEPEAPAVRYGIQISATTRTIPAGSAMLMGYEPLVVRVGSLNKYVIAVSENLDKVKEKLPEVRKKIPDCFIVRISNGEISIVR